MKIFKILFCIVLIMNIFNIYTNAQHVYRIGSDYISVNNTTNEIYEISKGYNNENAVVKIDSRKGITQLGIESTNSEKFYSHKYLSTKGDTVFIGPQVVVKLRSGNIEDIVKQFNGDLSIDRFSRGNYKLKCNCSTSEQVLDIIDRLKDCKEIEWCEPGFLSKPIKFNPLYSQQYYLKNTGQNGGISGKDINIEGAWEITQGDSTIVVAVIDDGVEHSHEDIYRVLSGYTMYYQNGIGEPQMPSYGDKKYHGTACAGIIAGSDNNLGIKGVAPNISILPVNIFPNLPNYVYYPSDIADAIEWASERADILSISWSFSYSQDIVSAITNAISNGRNGKGCVVVVSAGNYYSTNPDSLAFPATIQGVISVGAVDKNGVICSYSQRNSNLSLVAFGGYSDIVTTDRMNSAGHASGNYISDFGGTSAAAPQVAGVAALMLSINPNLTSPSVKSILENTATNIGNLSTYGHGLVNAGAAVQQVNQLMTTPMYISGPTILHDSAVYEVCGLSTGMRVKWYFPGLYQCIEDYPEYNKCTLIRGTNNYSTGPIIADVYLDSVMVKHLYMSLRPFSASYYQESCAYHGVGHPAIQSQTLTPEIAHFIHQGCLVHLVSDFFTGQNVTYSGVTPETWSFYGTNQVIFSLPLGSGGIPFQVTLNPNGTSYEKRFLFFSIGNNSNSTSLLNIEALSGSEFLISIKGDGRLYQSSNNKNETSHVDSWFLEAYNMNNGTQTFGQQIQGSDIILNTSAWQPGNYIIRAVVDGDVLTEKIQVKR